jgi:V8-like Glu-specific endopeptidase
MKRRSCSVLHTVVVLLAVTSAATASTAAADDGSGPLGVTAVAAPTPQAARVGALFVGGRHFCTASVVHSPHHDLVVTAAHCTGHRAGDVVFVPGYRDGRAPYGEWRLRRWFLSDRWARGRDEDSDVAFAQVESRAGEGVEDGKGVEDGEEGEDVEDVVGGNRFVVGMATGATAVTVTGYPDSRETPVSCTNRPALHSRTQQRIDCPDFSGGTSGSPWVNGDGDVVGVLGGHEDGGATADVSYSVVFGAEAAGLYREATCDPHYP